MSYHHKNWRVVPGYEGCYVVNDVGEVWSLARKGTAGGKLVPSLVTGYERVGLLKGGKKRSVLVHRLVAEVFVRNPGGMPQVNHKNGIKRDNRVSNLEWVTCSDNIAHAYRTGLHPGQKGDLNGNSHARRLTLSQ